MGYYFKPYVAKILHTYKPLVYIDCFAGKGKFDDGNDGSPLIALRIIDDCLASTKIQDPHIEAMFIDVNYADALHSNLKDYPKANIVSGKYEDNITKILQEKTGCNVFLYVDPYGIKALKCSLFDDFAKGQFNTIELLVNMNSFGFIREACHALGTSFEDESFFEDLIEYETTRLNASSNSIDELNEIAGGDYWQSIIKAYKNGEINGYDAEARFSVLYCERLRKSYKYVLNMPLRIKRGQHPKYRMIHATNHKDGCLLMVDNICSRWESLKEIQQGNQMSLWEENYDNQVFDIDDIRKKATAFFSHYSDYISLYDALAEFFVKYGPICDTSCIKSIIKDFEKDGLISIFRSPKTTKNGKPSTFMSEEKGKRVFVRWIK